MAPHQRRDGIFGDSKDALHLIRRGRPGLPAGVQIITRQYGDYAAIRFAELLEKEYGGFVPPPGY